MTLCESVNRIFFVPSCFHREHFSYLSWVEHAVAIRVTHPNQLHHVEIGIHVAIEFVIQSMYVSFLNQSCPVLVDLEPRPAASGDHQFNVKWQARATCCMGMR
jgi:hypothetical protein